MKKHIKTIIAIFLFLAIFLFSSCTIDDNEVYINGPSEMMIGGEAKFTYKLKYEISDNNAVFESSDEEIASFVNGNLVAYKEGVVTITVKIADLEGKHEVSIQKEKNEDKKSLFSGVNLITTNPICFEKVELSLLEKEVGFIKDNYNPYDYEKIYVYASFKSPSGKTYSVPAFWYRDYEITIDESFKSTSSVSGVASENKDEIQGLERVVWLNDDFEYRLRFQPSESGIWNYIIYVSLDGVIEQTIKNDLEVKPSDASYNGIIKVDETNNRSFVFENGKSFIPIGENLGWWTSSSRKTYDYNVWMEKFKQNNMNMTRIWMAPWGFSLHSGKSYNNFDDRLNQASRLDKVIELANQNDIYIMLCLVNHGQFSSSVNSTWNDNPYNEKKGGILSRPEYFFINNEAKKAFKNELLYIIGRYGYSDNIMAWELFNEVNWTDNADTLVFSSNIKNWHDEMALFLKNNDPYNHMVTTSYNGETGPSYSLDSIDFINPHNYGYTNKNINTQLPIALEKLFKMYNKPVLQSEIGINWESGYETYKADKTGVCLRQNSWAGMLGGGAGGAMNWWWDSWVHPYDLYYQFKGAGKIAKLISLSGSDYKLLQNDKNVKIDSRCGIIGYEFSDRIYGYVFDKSWTYVSNNSETINNCIIDVPFSNGNYKITFYNALTGDIISSKYITSSGALKITLPSFREDIAFIVEGETK